MENQNLLVLSGPSGIGKSFLSKYLLDNYPFKAVLSTMTRPPRAHEIPNVDNEYVTDSEYQDIQNSGDFFMDNKFFNYSYGYRRSFISNIIKEGCIPVIIIFTPIADQVFREYPDACGIFLQPQSIEFLEQRLLTRGDSAESITQRLKSAETEIDAYNNSVQKLYAKKYTIQDDNDIFPVIKDILAYYQIS